LLFWLRRQDIPLVFLVCWIFAHHGVKTDKFSVMY
jgi:hypothetical protein